MNLPAAARVWIARHSAARRYALESGRDHAKFVNFSQLVPERVKSPEST